MALISGVSFVSSTATLPCFQQFESTKYRNPKRHHISKVACSRIIPNRRNAVIGLGIGIGGFVSLNKKAFGFGGGTMFPLVLDSAVSAVVKRPSKSRSKKQKEEEEEVLVIEGIEFQGNTYTKFDVIVNAQDDYNFIRPHHTQFAGSFVSLPRSQNKNIVTSISLGLTDLLDNLGADDDDSLLVTLLPRGGRVKIRAIKTLLLAH